MPKSIEACVVFYIDGERVRKERQACFERDNDMRLKFYGEIDAFAFGMVGSQIFLPPPPCLSPRSWSHAARKHTTFGREGREVPLLPGCLVEGSFLWEPLSSHSREPVPRAKGQITTLNNTQSVVSFPTLEPNPRCLSHEFCTATVLPCLVGRPGGGRSLPMRRLPDLFPLRTQVGSPLQEARRLKFFTHRLPSWHAKGR